MVGLTSILDRDQFAWLRIYLKKQSCRAESSHSRLQNVPSLCRRFAFRNIPVSAVRIKVGRVMYRTQPVTAGAIFVVRFVELRKSCACRTKLIDGEIYRNALPIRATHALANDISTDCAQTWRVLYEFAWIVSHKWLSCYFAASHASHIDVGPSLLLQALHVLWYVCMRVLGTWW